MSQSHYAPPSSNTTPDSHNINGLIVPLADTKPWVRLCSIVGFIFTGLTVLIGIGMMIGGASSSNVNTPGMPMSIAAFGAIYVVMAALYFFPSLFLFKYANAIARAQVSHSQEDILSAIQSQKSFWKFVGILVIVMFVFMIVGIGAAIMIPAMMAI